ncbi:hypothetical protein FQN51_003940, partial [Onygenales sp. PD_10]
LGDNLSPGPSTDNPVSGSLYSSLSEDCEDGALHIEGYLEWSAETEGSLKLGDEEEEEDEDEDEDEEVDQYELNLSSESSESSDSDSDPSEESEADNATVEKYYA